MRLKQELLVPANAQSLDWLYSKFDEACSNYANFVPSKTESTETLGLWFQRVIRRSAESAQLCKEAPKISQLDDLIYLSIDRWTEGDPAYKGALMRTLKEILVFRCAKYGFEGFNNLVQHALSHLRTSSKTTFGVLEIFARSSTEAAAQTVQALDNEFLAEAFSILAHQSQRGGTVGRCLAALLSNSEPQTWFHFTAPYLKETTEQQNVAIYFLEPSLKQSANALSRFSSYLELCKSLNDSSVEIACLKAAKNASLDISEHVTGSEVIARSLKALSKPLRFDALTLVCRATRKLTVPVPSETFQLIQDNASSLFAEGDPQSRADAISCLRHLMLRINTSTRKHPSKDAENFIKFLLEWAAGKLQPGMPYRCLAMGINLLKLLSQHSVNVCSPQVISSLLNCVASDYGDIREASVAILQTAESLPLIETHLDELVATALSLLSRSRTGDAGARLLQFLSSCRPDINLGEIVIAAISASSSFAKSDLLAAAKDHSVHGFLIALRIIPYYSSAIIPLVYDIWDACTGPLLGNAPEGTDDVIMNYCWKAVKESCALVESIATNEPTMIPDVKELLQKLATMLTDITHWGAFSAVPPAYRAVAKLDPQLSSHIIWGEVRSLLSKEHTRLVTRRSAGLPLLATSALVVRFETAIVEELFSIANIPFDEKTESEDLALPQVHAINCINAFVTDAELAKISGPYVERALQLALERYTSPSWSLRNCAAMLFAKLHTRLFGVKAPVMAAGSFFIRYKSCRALLKEQLSSKTKDSDLHSVYPALAIIANLQTSVEDDSLDDFWEPIAYLLGSKSWKVREMAARALKAATQEDMLIEAIETLLQRLKPTDQNQMHGIGMAVNQMLTLISFVPELRDSKHLTHTKKIITVNKSMETNRELFKAWIRLGGHGRIVDFDALPSLAHLNPSIASFEAEQAKEAPADVMKYASSQWAPVLRVLPDRDWDLQLSKTVLEKIDLPDIQCRCLQALQSMEYEAEMGTMAAKLLAPSHAQSVRQQALVLSSKANDLNIDRWLTTVEEFSVDEAAIECRMSATKSIGNFLEGPLGVNRLDSRQRSVLFYILFKLLSDDEEVVRTEAAGIASRYLDIELSAPPACEPMILSQVDPKYITSQLLRNISSDAERARAAFEDSTDVLFVVEKESLFRDDLGNIQLQGKFCARMPDIPAARILDGLDWETPFQARADSGLLEIRARLEAVQGTAK